MLRDVISLEPISIATRGGALHYLIARTGQAGQTELALHTDGTGDPPRFSRPEALQMICDAQRSEVAGRGWDYGVRLVFARNLVNLAVVKLQLGGVRPSEVWDLLNEADDQFQSLIAMGMRGGRAPLPDAVIGLATTRYNSAILALAQGTPQHIAGIAKDARGVLANVRQGESPQECDFLQQALSAL